MAAHEGLVRWVVCRQHRGALVFADALHAGRLGLWQALRGYDPGRGTRFSTYAVSAIRHAVWAAVAAAGESVTAPVGWSVERTAPVADPVECRQAAVVAAQVRATVAALAPRERAVVVAHYGLDGTAPQSFAAIGRRLGVTRQRVQQLHAAAVVWLAQPAHSLALRRLLGRDQRTDYRQALARQRRLARPRHPARPVRAGRRARVAGGPR
jgi:RNA polymerase sigma factor (sigma-70 family)